MTQHSWPAIALARAASGELTADASLATLDFAVRHRWIEPLSTEREPTGAGQAAAQRAAFEALRPGAWTPVGP